MCIIHNVKIYSKPKNYKLYNKTYKNKLKGENMKKTEILNLSNNKINKTVKIRNTKFDRSLKLTDTQIKDIKEEYAKGKSITDLAKKYHVVYSTIDRWVNDSHRQANNAKRGSYGRKYMGAVKSLEKFNERADYKRSLISNNKIKLSTIGA